jgi:7,8-dihydropterin-6-yl-methyl-4-(beta-D-ribofuranosyl)aminobenzene 5'-phosphate synthase
MPVGGGKSILHNARQMDIDLSKIDKIVLSHGHYDHCGGLTDVLKLCGETDIYAHPAIFTKRFARHNGKEINVSLPFSRRELEALGAKFTLSHQPINITDAVITSGEIPMLTSFEQLDKDLFIRKNGVFMQDPLDDDLSLIIKSDKGLIVILGGAHRGVINIIKQARIITSQNNTLAVIGGCHLFRTSNKQIEATSSAISEMDIVKLGVSHCTGFKAAAHFSSKLPDAFFQNNGGDIFSI